MDGAVLAGGQSTRMGTDKALMQAGDVSFLGHIVFSLHQVMDRVMIISSSPKHDLCEKGTVRYPDIVEGVGPLGGIHTALYNSKSEFVFCCACDMPFVSPKVITLLAGECSGWDVVVPEVRGKLHPLSALYSKKCIGPVQEAIKSGQLKISHFYDKVRVNVLGDDFFEEADPRGISFTNINNHSELAIAQKHFPNLLS